MAPLALGLRGLRLASVTISVLRFPWHNYLTCSGGPGGLACGRNRVIFPSAGLPGSEIRSATAPLVPAAHEPIESEVKSPDGMVLVAIG